MLWQPVVETTEKTNGISILEFLNNKDKALEYIKEHLSYTTNKECVFNAGCVQFYFAYQIDEDNRRIVEYDYQKNDHYNDDEIFVEWHWKNKNDYDYDEVALDMYNMIVNGQEYYYEDDDNIGWHENSLLQRIIENNKEKKQWQIIRLTLANSQALSTLTLCSYPTKNMD